jgi:hypothetical protein
LTQFTYFTLGGLVIPRQFLRILVLAMPILVVAFAVVMGGSSLIQATGDALAARVMRWVAAAVLVLAVTDLLLLVTVLGLKALEEADSDSNNPGD